jgi:hypothetical protein
LFEVVSKAGKNMNEASRNAILSLIDNETDDSNGKQSVETFVVGLWANEL